MALVNQPSILPGEFAAEGDKNTIPANNDGLSGLASIAKGFPQITQVPLAQGGQPPQRQDFNGIFNLFSQFLLYAQNGGVYAYNNTLDYQPPCIISYDGEFYSCLQENGPGTSAGVQAPTVATYWEKVIVNSALKSILSSYAKLNSPAFSGVPTVPTADAGTNTTQIASTAFVTAALSGIDLSKYALKSDLNTKANINSPALTGTPTSTTPASSDNSTRIATTAFVKAALSGIDLSKYALKSDLNTKANINSPALTGTPTSTTPASSDNSTRIATTAFVKALVGAANNGGIVSANLAQNGYVKFANGFILQWGTSSSTITDTQVTYPLKFNTLFAVCGSPKSSGNLSGSKSNFGIKSQSTTGFIANMYDAGSGYAGFNWIAAGK